MHQSCFSDRLLCARCQTVSNCIKLFDYIDHCPSLGIRLPVEDFSKMYLPLQHKALLTVYNTFFFNWKWKKHLLLNRSKMQVLLNFSVKLLCVSLAAGIQSNKTEQAMGSRKETSFFHIASHIAVLLNRGSLKAPQGRAPLGSRCIYFCIFVQITVYVCAESSVLYLITP